MNDHQIFSTNLVHLYVCEMNCKAQSCWQEPIQYPMFYNEHSIA